MKTKTNWMAALTLAAGLIGTPLAAHEVKEESVAKVQLALLLDTSNSMDGLINQAKAQLWAIVNNFDEAKRDGREVFVEVALYEYGNAALSAEGYWIREVLPFTRDLDELSKQLFELRTNGGEEYCGAVLKRAIEQLAWDEGEGAFKAIVIAGNEPFTQGGIDAGSACREAMRKGVLVNCIHCGGEQEGIKSGWKSGALVTGGNYSFIDQNKAVVSIDCPQDQQILELNEKLNRTYMRYGARGFECAINQALQDKNAATLSKDACVVRVATKTSASYWNGSWDLVDAMKQAGFELENVKEEELPESLRGLTIEQKKAEVAKQSEQRAAIQARIQVLNAERAVWLQKELEKRGEVKGGTLGDEVSDALKKQWLGFIQGC